MVVTKWQPKESKGVLKLVSYLGIVFSVMVLSAIEIWKSSIGLLCVTALVVGILCRVKFAVKSA